MTNASRAALVLAVAGPLSIVLACLPGPAPIPAREALTILASGLGLASPPPDPALATVVLGIRASRAVLAYAVGAGLALAGTAFQGILRNPLADPFTLGVSTGAAFGASLALALGLSAPALLPLADPLPFFGLLGALAALLAVLALARSGRELRRETLVLAGVVTATFLSACIALLKALDESSVSGIVFWIMGSFQGRGWGHVLVYLPYLALGSTIILAQARELDLLSLGSAQARLLGLNADRSRLLLLVAASLLSGAAVAVSGVIGFVGLVVPHLVRRIQGAEHGPLTLNAALLGGLLLLWSDVLARTLLPGGVELPVGVLTALLGGPFFCLLLKRRAEAA
ncbi:MAG: iron ABC transporter permease [Desulfovibrionaceae bacterium]|nr:iron ABC transporter permease [Desulfovibrionaceae bacterium]